MRKIQQEQRILLDKVNGLQLQLNEVNNLHNKKIQNYLLPVITIGNKLLIIACHIKSGCWVLRELKSCYCLEESSISLGPLHETFNVWYNNREYCLYVVVTNNWTISWGCWIGEEGVDRKCEKQEQVGVDSWWCPEESEMLPSLQSEKSDWSLRQQTVRMGILVPLLNTCASSFKRYLPSSSFFK